MSVFVSSKSAVADQHGVFAIEQTPPAIIQAIGTGVVAVVGQFPWGPPAVLETPPTFKDAQRMFAPAGFVRTGSAYLALIQKAFSRLRLLRVLGPTAAKAVSTLVETGPVNVATVTLKYAGASGNAVVGAVEAATDGDADHFNLRVTITGASGSTEDLIENLNFSGTGDETVPSLESALLVGTIAKLASGRPDNGAITFASGTDGTVTAAEYIGTAGTGDKGFAVLEGDNSINHVVTDDPGNTLRDAVTDGGIAHANLKGDRAFYTNGNSGISAATAITDVADHRSGRCAYVFPWVYIRDDVTAAEQLVPPAPFAASVASQVSPSTSIAWKNSEVQAMLKGIIRTELVVGASAPDLTRAGIIAIIREELGGHTFESDVVTLAPTDPARKSLKRRRMGDYIAASFVRSSRGGVDAPNVEPNQDDDVIALDTFLSGLKKARLRDPNHTPHIKDYSIQPTSASNTEDELDAGDFNINATAKTSSGKERIFLNFNFGENVRVTAT